MNPEILTFLLHGRKISMPDRTERGLSPHPPIKLPEVERHLAGILGHERRFPHKWHDHKQDQAIHTGGVIERKGRSKYIYRAARAWPMKPFVIAEVAEKVFPSPEEAAAYCVKRDPHLPADLYGWRVIE